MNAELSPRLRLAITRPSYAWIRLRSPSTTLTLTTTVSPVLNSGMDFPRRVISSFSSVCIRSIVMLRLSTIANQTTSSDPAKLGDTRQFLLEFLEQRALVIGQYALIQQ